MESLSHFEDNIPVFKPTYAQFCDFELFVRSVDDLGRKSGLIKIVPPQEWLVPVSKDAIRNMKHLKVVGSIQQEFERTNGGAYRVNITEKRKKYSVEEFRELAESHAYVGKKNTKHDDLQTHRDIERQFWRTLTFTKPIYGADMKGSLFDKGLQVWNMQELPNLLTKISNPLPGVNSPYLYFGMWKAAFAWHLEDMDLYSINMIHYGKSKQWYVIRPEFKDRFEALAKRRQM